MKRLIAVILMIMISFFAFAQEGDDWYRDQSFEQIFRAYDIQVECWVNDAVGIINFEDITSRSFDDVLFQLGYIMTIFDIIFTESGESFETMGISQIIYSYFIIKNARYNRYHKDQLRYDFFMGKDWLNQYYAKTPRDRQRMLLDLFNRYYYEWFPPQQQQVVPLKKKAAA